MNKNIKSYVLIVLVIASSAIADAQDNTSDKRWNFYVGAGYSRNNISGPALMDGSDWGCQGVAFDGKVSYQLFSKLPLDAFVGMSIAWTEQDKERNTGTTIKRKATFWDIPVGLQYRYGIDKNFTIVPSIALDYRYGIKLCETYDLTTASQSYEEDFYKHNSSRHQLAARIGLSLEYQQFYLGYAFVCNLCGPKIDWGPISTVNGESSDPTHIKYDMDVKTHFITLGYHF